MEHVDTVVIGAGVVGLAVARAQALHGREVLVLDAATACGTATSARNSGVVHGGLYYPPRSLKARLCVAGRELLDAYAAARGIALHRCGKLIVATTRDELATLAGIAATARANGVGELCALDAAAARQLEPEVRCVAALHSPVTGIIDTPALLLALQADIAAHGGLVALATPVTGTRIAQGRLVLTCGGAIATELAATRVVNCAGHGAAAVLDAFADWPAAMRPRPAFAKGNYFSLRGPQPFRRLVYPVPVPGGLGIHATLDLAGRTRFGPDVEWVDNERDLSVDPSRAEAFAAAIRRYWPGLPDDALAPDFAGIRPKLCDGDGHATDFRIDGPRTHGIRGYVALLGIESPGLTAALAIGEHVAALLDAEAH